MREEGKDGDQKDGLSAQDASSIMKSSKANRQFIIQ
jgi:hypothetical protein